MSFLSVMPDSFATVCGNLAELGAALHSASAAAANPTTLFTAPAADEISVAITALFRTNAYEFQKINARAATYHDQFVNLLRSAATQYLTAEVANVERTLAHALIAPAEALLGHPVISDGANGATFTAASAYSLLGNVAAVPLRMAGTHPIVDVSVGGGATTPLVVDTGSKGLVVPAQHAILPFIWNQLPLSWVPAGGDIFNPFAWAPGFILNPLAWLSGSIGIEHNSYAAGLEYWSLKFPTTVSFGNDLYTGSEVVTGQTQVNAIVFAQDFRTGHLVWPGPSISFGPFGGVHSFSEYFGSAGGVLGIGPHAPGSGPNVIAALPGALGAGVVLDEPAGLLYFGPSSAFGAGVGASTSTAPFATVGVSINGGPLHSNISAVFDSGGGYGSIPQSLVPGYHVGDYLPVGTRVTVYNSANQFLYSYVTPGTIRVTGSSDLFNTGNGPFSLGAWWIASN